MSHIEFTKQIDLKMQTNRQTKRDKNTNLRKRQIEWQTDRQIDEQTDKSIDRHQKSGRKNHIMKK